jgi:hypothetical protein
MGGFMLLQIHLAAQGGNSLEKDGVSAWENLKGRRQRRRVSPRRAIATESTTPATTRGVSRAS